MGADIKKCVWKKIRNDLFQHLVDMQFSKRSLSDYNWIFNRLEKFMQSRDESSYSVRIGRAFTKEMLNTVVYQFSVVENLEFFSI